MSRSHDVLLCIVLMSAIDTVIKIGYKYIGYRPLVLDTRNTRKPV